MSSRETGRTASERARLSVQVFIGALALSAVIWFAVANFQRVEVDWFLVTTSSPLVFVIVLSAVLGALVDRLIRWRSARRRMQKTQTG
jgi:uncharacterized integral membrane protein